MWINTLENFVFTFLVQLVGGKDSYSGTVILSTSAIATAGPICGKGAPEALVSLSNQENVNEIVDLDHPMFLTRLVVYKRIKNVWHA